MNRVREISVVFLGNLAPALAAVVCIPVIVHAAGVETFGLLSVILLLSAYFSFLDLGVGVGINRRVSMLRARNRGVQLKTAIGTGVAAALAPGLLGALLLWTAGDWLTGLWLDPQSEKGQSFSAALRWVAASVPLASVTSALRGALEGFERFEQVSVVRGGLGALAFIVPAAIAGPSSGSLYEMTLAIVVVRACVCVAMAWALFQLLSLNAGSFKVERQEFLALRDFSGWIAVSNLVSQGMPFLERLLLASLLGASAVGFYAVPYDALNKLMIIPSSAATVLFPAIAAAIGAQRQSATGLYQMFLRFAHWGAFFLFVPLALLGTLVLELWIGTTFAEQAGAVFSVLAIGFLFVCIAHFPLTKVQAAGQSKKVAIFYALQTLAYLPCFYWAVQVFGLIGGAIAWSLRSLVDLVILRIFSREA